MSSVENVQEDPSEEVLRDTKYPHLKLMKGGKGPPEGPPVENWLEKLPLRSVFCCRANQTTVDWELYFLIHKYTNIYLLKMETPDGKIWERRVDPKMFCKHYRDYELIAVEPEPTYEQRTVGEELPVISAASPTETQT